MLLLQLLLQIQHWSEKMRSDIDTRHSLDEITTVFLYFFLSSLLAGQCGVGRKMDPAELSYPFLDIEHHVESGTSKALLLFP